MNIYLLYEKCFDTFYGLTHTNVYPYRNYEDVLNRIVDETGKDKEEIRQSLSVGDCEVETENFSYSVEETELL